MRLIVSISKLGRGAYMGHLDLQRTLQRALRRAELPLRYSQGFNPHPELHFATALSTGFESSGEWLDVELTEAVEPLYFVKALNRTLPEGLWVNTAFIGPDTGFGSLAAHLLAAGYELRLQGDYTVPQLKEAIDTFLAGEEWLVDKRTKSGIKPQNIRPQIYTVELADSNCPALLRLTGELTAASGFRPEALVQVLSRLLNTPLSFSCKRTGMYFDGFLGLPMPEERKNE